MTEKEFAGTIYGMKLGEEVYVGDADLTWIRVPGGWLVSHYTQLETYGGDGTSSYVGRSTSTFIPYNEEFRPNKGDQS